MNDQNKWTKFKDNRTINYGLFPTGKLIQKVLNILIVKITIKIYSKIAKINS